LCFEVERLLLIAPAPGEDQLEIFLIIPGDRDNYFSIYPERTDPPRYPG
jgi:hypothetical protein